MTKSSEGFEVVAGGYQQMYLQFFMMLAENGLGHVDCMGTLRVDQICTTFWF